MPMEFNFISKLKTIQLLTGDAYLNINSALEAQFGDGALEKFDQEAKANMGQMNNFSTILYSKFKDEILKS